MSSEYPDGSRSKVQRVGCSISPCWGPGQLETGVVLTGACSQLSIVLHCLSSSAGPGCLTLQERWMVQPCSVSAPRFFCRFSFSSFGVLYCKKSVIELSWPWLCLQGFFTLQTAHFVGGYLTMIKKSWRQYTSWDPNLTNWCCFYIQGWFCFTFPCKTCFFS